MAKHIFKGWSAPTFAPRQVGHHYVDMTTGDQYISKGIATSADWVKLTPGLDINAKVAATDTTTGYLKDKLVAGTAIAITEQNIGGNETLLIEANGSAFTDEKVKVSSNDATTGYLNGKLVSESGIVLTETNDAGDETLVISPTYGYATNTFTEGNDKRLRVQNIVKVNKDPGYGEFSSIADACDSILDSSDVNPYLIDVGPGIYTERLISVPDYVYIRGASIYSTMVEPDAANHHVFDLGNSNEISFLTVQNAGPGYAAITTTQTSALGDFIQMHKVSIYDCDIGILVDASARNIEAYAEYVDINGTYTIAVKIISANGYTAITNLENFYTFPDDSGTTTSEIYVDGPNARLTALACVITGNGVDNGILITNGAYVATKAINFVTCATGIYADTNGTIPKIYLEGVFFKDCTMNFNIANTTAIGNYTGYTEYLKKSINDSNLFFITGVDRHIITVSDRGSDFTSIKAANDAITNNDATHRYTINVGPGVYVEDPIIMKPYVSIKGSSRLNTIIQPITNTQTTITGCANSSIEGVTIDGADGVGGIGVLFNGNNTVDVFYVKNCTFNHNETNIKADGSLGIGIISLDSIEFDTNFVYGIDCITASSNELDVVVSNFEVLYYLSNANLKVVKLSGLGVRCGIKSSLFNCVSGVGQGFNLSDGAELQFIGSSALGFDKGIVVENTGVGSIVNCNCVLSSITKDIEINHTGTTGSITGSLDYTKVTVVSDAIVSMSYSDHGTVGQVVLQDLYQGSRHDRLINLSKLVRSTTTLGLESGGVLTIASGRILNVSAGTGFLLDPTDAYIKEISWDATTVTIPADQDHYVFVDTTGTVTSSQSVQNLKQVIFLGRVHADTTTFDFIEASDMELNHYSNEAEIYLRNAIGPIFGTGCIVSENVSTPRSLDVTGGQYFFGIRSFTTVGGTAFSFETYWKNPPSSWYKLEAQTVVNNLQYDDGSGTLADLTAVAQVATVTPDVSVQSIQHYIQTIDGTPYDFTSDATPTPTEVVTGLTALINADIGCAVAATGTTTLILTAKVSGIEFTHSESANLVAVDTTPNTAYYAKHSIYAIGDTSNEKYFLVYSQAQYASLILAQEGSLPIPPTHLKDAVTLIATIIVRKSATNIIQVDDARPRIGFKPNSLSSVTVHGDLLGLANDDHQQYLLVDGTRAMTGNINMGGQNITSVNLVDGVDVSTHESRHLPNGADPLTTAAPSANLSSTTTNAVGIANSLSRSDHSHAISTAAPASQTPDQTNAVGVSANLARADHVHNLATGTPSTIGTVNAQGSTTAFARQDHVHAHGAQTDGALHAVATTSVNGFMSAADKTKLDGVAAGATNTPLSSTAPVNVDKSAAAVGVDTTAARADHKHDTNTAAPSTNLTATTSNGEGLATTLARSDHSHAISTAIAVDVGIADAIGTSASLARADHVHQGIHSLQATATGTPRYGDIVLEQADGITVTDSGTGTFTISTPTVGAPAHEMFEEFFFSQAGDLDIFHFQDIATNGGSAPIEAGAPTDNSYIGLVAPTTGTFFNATGVGGFESSAGNSRIKAGGGDLTLEYRVRVPVLSGTPQYNIKVGIMDSNTIGTPANGVYFTYSSTLNSGQWQAICRNASTSTTVNSSIAVVANQWYKLQIRINAAGNLVTYLVDGVSVGTSSTNIPTTNAMRLMFRIEKQGTSTTTARILNVDYVYYRMER